VLLCQRTYCKRHIFIVDNLLINLAMPSGTGAIVTVVAGGFRFQPYSVCLGTSFSTPVFLHQLTIFTHCDTVSVGKLLDLTTRRFIKVLLSLGLIIIDESLQNERIT